MFFLINTIFHSFGSPFSTSERDPVSAKVTFALTEITETWTHFELQLAVCVGSIITEVDVQHSFERTSTGLFNQCTNTFFTTKKQAQVGENKGLKKIAMLVINARTGKWGFS